MCWACRGMQQTPQHRIAVPTVSMQRTWHVTAALVAAGSHVLLAGSAGVLWIIARTRCVAAKDMSGLPGAGAGKSVVARALMDELPTYWGNMTIHLGALSSSASLQAALERGLEKRTKARPSHTPTLQLTYKMHVCRLIHTALGHAGRACPSRRPAHAGIH